MRPPALLTQPWGLASVDSSHPNEPDRGDALIGAIVLEELDLIAEGATETVHPRDPDRIVTEIE